MDKLYKSDGTELEIASTDVGAPHSIDISGIPVLHIYGTLPTSKDQGELPVKYTLFNGAERVNGFATLKVQGNSTAGYPKKNFTIKLYTDEAHKTKQELSFNDWGAQSKYVLKADWIDITHARNIVSARLWSDVISSRASYNNLPELYRTTPNNCVIDGFLIKVYANGVYWGRYSWNIPKDTWMFNMNKKNNNHCVLYSENYESGCFKAAAVIDGTDWSDEIHSSVPAAIVTRWNEVISFVRTSSDADFVSGIGSYIDRDSLIDYYVFIYTILGYDSFGKNQVYITYDGNLWYASVYDLDSTFGLYWDGSKFMPANYPIDYFDAGNLLYQRVRNLLTAEIKARYADLRAGALSESYIKESLKQWCDVSSAELMAQDYAPETGNGAFTNMPQKTTNNYEQLSTFISNRLVYTDSVMAQE